MIIEERKYPVIVNQIKYDIAIGRVGMCKFTEGKRRS